MPQLNFADFAPQLVWLVISFTLLYSLLLIFILPRLGGILKRRKNRIEGDLEAAVKMRDEADRAIAEYEQALADARHEAMKIAETARMAAVDDLTAHEAEMQARLNARLAAAEKQLAASRDEALVVVRQTAAVLMRDIVPVATGTAVTDDDIDRAIDHVLTEKQNAAKSGSRL